MAQKKPISLKKSNLFFKVTGCHECREKLKDPKFNVRFGFWNLNLRIC